MRFTLIENPEGAFDTLNTVVFANVATRKARQARDERTSGVFTIRVVVRRRETQVDDAARRRRQSRSDHGSKVTWLQSTRPVLHCDHRWSGILTCQSIEIARDTRRLEDGGQQPRDEVETTTRQRHTAAQNTRITVHLDTMS